MKASMKTSIFIIAGLIVILAYVLFFYKIPVQTKGKTEVEFVDYSTYTVDVSLETGNDIKHIGFACIYAKGNGYLQLLTAEHIVSDKNSKYLITFHNGKSVKITNVSKPVKNADLAIIEVSDANLKEGKEYLIPKFKKPQRTDIGQSLYVFGDEMDNYPRRMIDTIFERSEFSELHTAGSISKGRSGSPVFIKDSNVCVGIISGFFTKDSGVGEKTVILLY